MSRSEGKHIMETIEKYAKPPYDAHTDDMTVPFAIELAEKDRQLESLRGTLRYIAAQAKAGHTGALRVIQSNAEAALDGSLAKMQAAASAAS